MQKRQAIHQIWYIKCLHKMYSSTGHKEVLLVPLTIQVGGIILTLLGVVKGNKIQINLWYSKRKGLV